MKFVERLASREARTPLLIPLLFRLFEIQLSPLGFIRNAVYVLSGPIRDNVLAQVFEDLFGIAFKRVAVAGATAAESKQQISLVVDLRRTGDQLDLPGAIDCAFFQDVA